MPLPLYRFVFVPQAWSMAIELLFYLIAPWLSRRRVSWLVGLMFLSLALRFYSYHVLSLKHDPWIFRFFPTELVFFLTGCLSYRIYRKIKDVKIPRTVNRAIFLFVCLFTCYYDCLPVLSGGILPFSSNKILYFGVIAGALPFLFHYLKDNKVDNLIGQFSYPMYISHLLIASILHAIPVPLVQHSWVILTVTILFSWLLDVAVIRPVEKYRQRRVLSYEKNSHHRQ
jgi:peptidoglycan/LPS O-acetylase OafA/YrhL